MSWDWEKLKEQQQKRGEIPPQLNEFIKKFGDYKIPSNPLFILLILTAFIIAASMIYTVNVDEVGVVQRFGKFIKITQPGLNWKLPVGIDKVTKVKVRRVYKEEFGFRSYSSDKPAVAGENENNVAMMLTGDLNVAVVPWIVQYTISKPENWLFKVHNVQKLFRDMSEAAMRLVVGDRSINEVISKREEIAEEAKAVLQKELDIAETGVRIETIEMKRTNVPDPVQPSFNEVNQAVQEKEKMIYQAKEEYNKAIPSAKGEADRVIKAAEGYALDRVNRARGDAARFDALYKEYAKAKDVTKRRLYLETIKDVFPKMGKKYIIDADQKSVLPLLNLDKPGSEK